VNESGLYLAVAEAALECIGAEPKEEQLANDGHASTNIEDK